MASLRVHLLAGALALLAAGAAPASAAALGDAIRAADLVLEARVASAADEFGLSTLSPGRAVKRPGPLPEPLLARLPSRAAPGTSWLFLLVPDEMASSLGAWAPVDPDLGLVPLDGRAGRADDLLACADLAIAPPLDDAALGERLAPLVGKGDGPTGFALAEMLERPHLLAARAETLGPLLRNLIAARRVSPPVAALAVRALGAMHARGDDARLIDLVASEAPPVVVEAVAEAIAGLATPATAETLEHALGAATDAAVPGLLRLAGPCRARSLLPLLHERTASTRAEVRLAALASLAELADPSSRPALAAAAAHPDPITAHAARAALARLDAAP